MNEEIISIELPNKILKLRIIPFDTDIDIEDLLRIDYSNLIGEVLHWAVIYNRVMNLKAEQGHIVANAKFELDILEADLSDEHRNKITDKKGGKNATIDEVKFAVISDKKFQAKQKDIMNKEKDLAYLDSLYWAANAKNSKLDLLTRNITPAEFERELVEGKLNSLVITSSKKAIR